MNKIVFCIGVFVLLLCLAINSYAATWTNLGTFGDNPNLAVLAVYDGNLYTGGNIDGDLGTYNSVLGVWTNLGMCTRFSIDEMTVYDGNLYLNCATYLATYNSTANIFTEITNTGSGITAMAVFDGNLFVGLYNGNVGTYNSSSNVWTVLQDTGPATYELIVYNENLYLLRATALNGIMKYDSVACTFSSFSSTTSGGAMSAAVYDGNAYTTGAGIGTGIIGRFNSSGWENIGFQSDNLCPSSVVYDGNFFTGDSAGKIGAYSSTTRNWSTILTLTGNPSIQDMIVYNNYLYTADDDGVLGKYGPRTVTKTVTAISMDGISTEYKHYSYAQDNNLTLSFDVFNEDNNRMLVDINYSLVNTQGTGWSIVEDLNLTEGICNGTDWSNDANYLTCNWDWNIMQVPDANYYILIDMNTGFSYDIFDTSDYSFNIDNNKPITSWPWLVSTWSTWSLTIFLTCNDNFAPNTGSGCSTTMYRLDEDENFAVSMGDWQTYTAPFDVGDGNWRIDFNSTDYAGNVGDLNSFFLLIDANVPVTSYNVKENNTEWLNADFNLQFSCRETFDANSGCNALRTKINDGPLDTNSWYNNDQNIGILIHIDGNTLVSFYSTDLAGNEENIRQLNVALDKTKPITAWDGDNNHWQNWDMNVHLSCYDTGGSGCVSTKYKRDTDAGTAISFGGWQTYDMNVLFDQDGNWAIDFNSTDYAGNVGDTNRFFILVDKTKPTISSDVNGGWNLMGDANLQMSGSDALSGIDANWFRVDTNQYSTVDWGDWQNFDANILIDWQTYKDGNFAIQYFSRDAAGNDSNSDINSAFVYVLLDVNGPEWPTSISPSSGNYASAVTLVCGDVNCVRDINYVFQQRVNDGDWNEFYNGASRGVFVNIGDVATNSDLMFRCKVIDADKNSGWFEMDVNLTANPDTSFDTIGPARPLSNTVISTASAPFNVYTRDASGVSFCTFKIYKNLIFVDDYNGTPPSTAPDTNNGTWYYTYTSIVNGDLIYTDIFCSDNANNISPIISTATYTMSVSIAPPAPPSGPGGPGIVEKGPEIIAVPSLVNLYPSTKVIYLSAGVQKEFRLVIESVSDSDLNISVEPKEALAPFVFLGSYESVVPAKQSVLWQWAVRAPADANFEDAIESAFVVVVNEQEQVEVPLELRPQEFDIFAWQVAGFPIVLLALIAVTLIVTYVILMPRMQKKVKV